MSKSMGRIFMQRERGGRRRRRRRRRERRVTLGEQKWKGSPVTSHNFT
ncbi:hypothetical protein NC651_013787 [Populus alba x Populus x berolinensis]|nr:hypothetical protein NC651_013787 [Populus alba x Populus x berolinensis]